MGPAHDAELEFVLVELELAPELLALLALLGLPVPVDAEGGCCRFRSAARTSALSTAY
jgi:hypothetical protein